MGCEVESWGGGGGGAILGGVGVGVGEGGFAFLAVTAFFEEGAGGGECSGWGGGDTLSGKAVRWVDC